MMQTDDEVEERLEGIGKGDNSDAGENLIFGPPGTGKTRKLTRQIERAAARFGDDRVIATSFSKATAAEVAGRDVVIERDRIGTLHSYCFHALGEPAIAETHVEEWNKRNPSLRITPVSRQHRLDGEDLTDDGSDLAKPGDRLLQQLNRCRGLMLDSASWPTDVREFAARWKNYKASYQLLDFCDLIEQSSHHVPTAPGDPAVIIADEAQDLNPMQMLLVRKWGRRGEYYILAGDDDQTIYSWAGASPDAMLDPDIAEDHKIFLRQSYRVPRAVHSVAEPFIRQVSRRQEKIYLPRKAEGAVHRLSRGGYRSPEYGILKTAERHLAEGKTIMFLASCSYMLRPIVAVLRKNGIPFHNPYRKSNGFWNPLRTGSRHSAANRLLALLTVHPNSGAGRRTLTTADVRLFAEWFRSNGVLQPGARRSLRFLPSSCEVSLDSIFLADALESLIVALEGTAGDLISWCRDRMAPDFRSRIKFPFDIVAAHGTGALRSEPKVVVGTIHSVKGGQADVVYLFPDLSKSGEEQYARSGASRDSVIRAFYVGVTRARETLYICAAESSAAVAI